MKNTIKNHVLNSSLDKVAVIICLVNQMLKLPRKQVIPIDTTLSHINPKVLATVSIALVVAFAADMVYSNKNPNIGEGITDYDAYKNTAYVLSEDNFAAMNESTVTPVTLNKSCRL